MSEKHNMPIRNALKSYGFALWILEDLLGVSCMTITRMMRHELPEDEQKRIIQLIEKEGQKKC